VNLEYPPNTRLCLHEPYFKILFDGTHGIRVEDSNVLKNVISGEEDLSNLDAAGLREKGNACFKNSDFDKAIEFYEKALAKDNEKREISHLCLSNQSLCHLKKKEFTKAVEAAEKCIKIKPDYLKGYCRSSEALAKQGRIKDAAQKLMLIPESIPITDADEKTLRQLLGESAALPTTPLEIYYLLVDAGANIKRLSEYFFIGVCEHAVRVCHLTNFQAANRTSLEITRFFKNLKKCLKKH